MNQQNKTERWKDKLETAFYDSNQDAPDGEWFPLYQDIEKVVGELLSDARREAIKETTDEIRGILTNRFGNYGNEERLEIFQGELNDIEDRLTALATAEESIKNLK